MPGPDERLLLNEFVKVLIQGTDLNNAQKSALLHTDRSLSIWNRLVGTTGTRERVVKLEPTGEQDFVIHGKDFGGNIDALRTNASKQLQVDVGGLSIEGLLSMVLLELRLTNIHLGQVSGLTEATTDDVEVGE